MKYIDNTTGEIVEFHTINPHPLNRIKLPYVEYKCGKVLHVPHCSLKTSDGSTPRFTPIEDHSKQTLIMIERLIRFYQTSQAGAESKMSQIWRTVSKSYSPLTSALMAGDAEAVEAALNTIATRDSLDGLECGITYPFNDPLCLGYLERLAHAVGVLPFFQPNQISPTENWKIKDIENVVALIELELGFKLKVPSCFGLDENAGIPLRFLMYYCAPAFSIMRLTNGIPPKRILEIGAGLGNLGFIASRWGCESYTVIDLPHVAVLSAYFASKYAGYDYVWLRGEPEPEVKPFARFYPCTDFEAVRAQKFDLVFNSDSLPEMPDSVQQDYLALISEILDVGGIFLSVNHEGDQAGQRSVNAAVKENGNLNLISRHPYALQDGYVEEIYKPKL